MNRGALPLMWSAGVGVTVPLFAGRKQRPLVVEAEGLVASAAAPGDRSHATDRRRSTEERLIRMRSSSPPRRARRRGNPRPGPALGRRGARELPDRRRPLRHRPRGARHLLPDRRAAVGRPRGLPPGRSATSTNTPLDRSGATPGLRRPRRSATGPPECRNETTKSRLLDESSVPFRPLRRRRVAASVSAGWRKPPRWLPSSGITARCTPRSSGTSPATVRSAA